MAYMSPRGNLLAGIAVLALAVMEMLSGQSLGGYGRSIDRADSPKKFWSVVAIHYGVSLFFIGRYFYQISLISN
jgi:hypothetical protein